MSKLEPITEQLDPEQTAVRFDSFEECGEPVFDAEGFCHMEGIAVRPGRLSYKRADGSTWVEEVSPDVLKQAASHVRGLTATMEHPVPRPVVTAENWAKVAKGEVQWAESLPDGSTKVRVTVRDAAAIAAIKAPGGPRGLSLGYVTGLSPSSTPGVNAAQVWRKYNHLAIVRSPRSQGATLRADSLDAELVGAEQGDEAMSTKKIKIGGVEHEVPESAVSAIEALVTRADAAEAKVAELTGAASVLNAQIEQLRADAADGERIEALVTAKVDLHTFATKHHVPVTDAAGKFLPDAAIKRAVVAKALRADAADYAAVDGDELNGMFRAAKGVLATTNPRHPAYKSLDAAVASRADSANSPKVSGYAEALRKAQELHNGAQAPTIQ